MATALTEFKKHIAPDVFPCPGPVIDRELVRCIQEFCEKSHIITKHIEVDISLLSATTTTLDSVDVDLSTSFAGYHMVTVVAISLDGVGYEPEYMDLVGDLSDTTWDSIKKEGVIYFYFVDSDTLRVFERDPLTEQYLYLKIAVKPTSTVTTVDDLLYKDFLDTIVAGTKYRLLSMAGKEWSDSKAADQSFYMWRRGLSRAKNIAEKGRTRRPTEVTPRQFCVEC